MALVSSTVDALVERKIVVEGAIKVCMKVADVKQDIRYFNMKVADVKQDVRYFKIL